MIRIIRWELRQRRWAIFWWAVGSIVMTVAILALYPSIRDQAHQLNKVINTLPQGLRELKTGGANAVDVADPVAFLNSQLFYATLPILWIILAVTRGGSILGREEQTHTLELLLARPVSRGKLLLAKAVSFGLEFAIVGSATLFAILALAPAFAIHLPSVKLLLATAYTAVFSLSFGLIAFALQATSRLTRRGATAFAVFLGFGGYLIASLSGLTTWLKVPSKLAPYHYFAPEKILHGQAVTGLDVYLLGVLAFTILLAYFGFRRRDIE